jgi:hypothetical protein
MIVAGEPSGDAHAAALVKALRERGDLILRRDWATDARTRASRQSSTPTSSRSWASSKSGASFQSSSSAFRKLKAAAIENLRMQ